MPPVDSIAHPGEKNKGEIRGDTGRGGAKVFWAETGEPLPVFFLARRSLPLIFPGFF